MEDCQTQGQAAGCHMSLLQEAGANRSRPTKWGRPFTTNHRLVHLFV